MTITAAPVEKGLIFKLRYVHVVLRSEGRVGLKVTLYHREKSSRRDGGTNLRSPSPIPRHHSQSGCGFSNNQSTWILSQQGGLFFLRPPLLAQLAVQHIYSTLKKCLAAPPVSPPLLQHTHRYAVNHNHQNFHVPQR